MSDQLIKKIKDFVSSPKNENEYLSNHWNEIIKSHINPDDFESLIDNVKSSYYLEHYTLFKTSDNFIKHKEKEDKILFRKTLLSSFISNPILTLKVINKILKKSKSWDSIFFTQSITMETIGVLDEYFNYMKINNYLTDFSSQRLYYYFRVQSILIKNYLNAKKSLNILEIGAGGGNSAINLIRNNHVKNYVIVDLPEMLIYSAYHIKRNCKDFEIEFNAPSFNQLNENNKKVFFVTPSQLSKVPDNLIDFQFTINALMEMKINVSENYIKEMYRLGSEDSITMIVARINELFLEGDSKEINNPYAYNYNENDKIISFGPDFLQDNSRAILRTGPVSPSMITISKIKSNNDSEIKKLNFHRIFNFYS